MSKFDNHDYEEASDLIGSNDAVGEVIKDLTMYYKANIDNGMMTHMMWILELTKCMLLPKKYKKDLYQAIKEYDKKGE